MATVDVLNMQGDTVGQLELADAIFNAPVREHLLWEVVVSQLAARRRGTSSTKTRAEVRGAKKKVYRQKGTGNARHGTIRAPIYVGGGRAHGPKPRSYYQRTPKKVRRGALISALSLRNQEKKLLVLDNLDLAEIKTKRMAELLKGLGVETGLIIDDKGNQRLVKSMRNLAKAKYLAPEGLNVYDVLKYRTLVVTREGAKRIEERLAR